MGSPNLTALTDKISLVDFPASGVKIVFEINIVVVRDWQLMLLVRVACDLIVRIQLYRCCSTIWCTASQFMSRDNAYVSRSVNCRNILNEYII